MVPPHCHACGQPVGYPGLLCEPCAGRLDRQARPAPRRRRDGLLIHAAYPYAGVARRLVHAYKFAPRPSLGVELAELILARLMIAPPAVLVPVPPDPWRLRRRGFDPVDILVAHLAEQSGCDLARCLARRHAPAQAGSDRAHRIAAGPVLTQVGPIPRRALLIDDVSTTGTTLQRCADALANNCPDGVEAACFACA